MEHHSNIVPWQLLAERTGATLRWFGLTDDGRLDLSNIDELITERTKVVSLTWVSNMLGTINPIAEIAAAAHEVGAIVVVDASQAVPQLPVDVVDARRRPAGLHRPQGGRPDRHRRALGPPRAARAAAAVPRWRRDDRDRHDGASTYAALPHKFEAGTPPIARRSGSARPSTTCRASAWSTIAAHEQAITALRPRGAGDRPGPDVLGPPDAAERGGAICFEIDGVHPHDVATVLDTRGIAVRAGHHCAKPAHARFGVQTSTRVSSYLYTTPAEIDALVEGLEYTRTYFKV